MEALLKKKYLSDLELQELGKDIDLSNIELMSVDSINETLIWDRLLKTGKVNQFCAAAINLAVIGFGNQVLGFVKVNDEMIDIKHLIVSNGGKVDLKISTKLKEDDFTPNRLCRLFRNQIRNYLIATGFQTYLQRKFGNNEKFAQIAFRGAEYLELQPEEEAYLVCIYEALDAQNTSTVADRIKRVCAARKGIGLKIQRV